MKKVTLTMTWVVLMTLCTTALFTSCKNEKIFPSNSTIYKPIKEGVSEGFSEKIVRYSPDADDDEKTRAREAFMAETGIRIQETRICVCDPNLVVWSGEGLERIPSPQIPPMGGQCKSKATTGKDPDNVIVDVNDNLHFNAPTVNYETNPLTAPTNLSGIKPGDGAHKIAIVDGLLDFDLWDKIGLNRAFALKGDSYDFVNGVSGSNNFTGSNAANHQALVSAIFAKEMIETYKNRNFSLLVLNVFDDQGVGDVFSLSCAFAYARQKGAKIINASLGFYLDSKDQSQTNENSILEYYVDQLAVPTPIIEEPTLLIAAAGNGTEKQQSVNITEQPFYPACFSRNTLTGEQREHVIAVTSAASYAEKVIPYYNTSETYVDVAHATIEAKHPNPYYNSNPTGTIFTHPQLRGTSFSTPTFAAQVAHLLQTQQVTAQDKSHIFDYLIKNGKINIGNNLGTINNKCFGCP
ncbi:MAG: S8/S53 family peptidase [Chitinophagaceae bacterium]|nr:S8/S53 family peptidase [Chitinophagaceae bacterium]